jgi:hypothetical protein
MHFQQHYQEYYYETHQYGDLWSPKSQQQLDCLTGWFELALPANRRRRHATRVRMLIVVSRCSGVAAPTKLLSLRKNLSHRAGFATSLLCAHCLGQEVRM